MKHIAIGHDHAGYEYIVAIVSHLKAEGFRICDFGCDFTEPVDYPAYISAVAKAVAENHPPKGILIGGSENEAIVANRITGIRCAVVWNEKTARLSKVHENCNMISIGQHQRRIDQIDGDTEQVAGGDRPR